MYSSGASIGELHSTCVISLVSIRHIKDLQRVGMFATTRHVADCSLQGTINLINNNWFIFGTINNSPATSQLVIFERGHLSGVNWYQIGKLEQSDFDLPGKIFTPSGEYPIVNRGSDCITQTA